MRTKRKRRGSILKKTAYVVGGVFLAAAAGLRIYRHSQVFCPEREPTKSWDPSDYGIPPEAVEEHWIDTPDGERLYAWYCRSQQPRASAVFCHGNTGNITISADMIPCLLKAGLNVLFFDYRGFGKSSGMATYAGVIADGVTASRYHESLRPKDLPSILYGFSLGGGVAAQVLGKYPFDALVLHSTFTSLADETRFFHPKMPLHLFAGDLFDTIGVVKELQLPLLVLHGTEDETCPFWMGKALYEAAPSPKWMHVFEDCLHKDTHLRYPDLLVQALSDFIGRLPQPNGQYVIPEPSRMEQWTDSALRTIRRAFRKVPA